MDARECGRLPDGPDPMRLQILPYEPEGDKFRLIGAEWFVPLATSRMSTLPSLASDWIE